MAYLKDTWIRRVLFVGVTFLALIIANQSPLFNWIYGVAALASIVIMLVYRHRTGQLKKDVVRQVAVIIVFGSAFWPGFLARFVVDQVLITKDTYDKISTPIKPLR